MPVLQAASWLPTAGDVVTFDAAVGDAREAIVHRPHPDGAPRYEILGGGGGGGGGSTTVIFRSLRDEEQSFVGPALPTSALYYEALSMQTRGFVAVGVCNTPSSAVSAGMFATLARSGLAYCSNGDAYDNGTKMPRQLPEWSTGAHVVGVGVDPDLELGFFTLDGVVVGYGQSTISLTKSYSLVVGTNAADCVVRVCNGPRFSFPLNALLGTGRCRAVIRLARFV
jgi:hypothetical protein